MALLPRTEVRLLNAGVASIFALAKQYDATPDRVNNLSAKFVSFLACMNLS